VAAAEILRVGVGMPDEGGAALGPSSAAVEENKAGLLAVTWGAVASAGFAAVAATRVFAAEVDWYFRLGPAAATGIGTSFSLALFGAGHLVGISVGLSFVVGLVFAWGIATPVLTALHPIAGTADTVAPAVWAHKVRFVGAGAIGIAAIWALIKLAAPVIRGVQSAIAASGQRSAGGRAALVSVACLGPLTFLLAEFLAGGPLAALTIPLVVGALVYVVIAGFLVAAACGYMAGLIGSSNSPVSGLAILSVLGAALLLVALTHPGDRARGTALVAYALFVTAVVLCVATIANDNLQDLKTGQLVDATPWRQQVALVVGVVSVRWSFRPFSICSTPHTASTARPPRTTRPARSRCRPRRRR
jgi:putative OPT family oligopeptide transporter